MTSSARIRLATPADAAAVAAIYAPFCESNVVSFEVAAPDAAEIARRISSITVQYPWLVLEVDGGVLGYAYAGRHRDRAAYGWSVDTAVYIGDGHRRQGVGTALYSTLFDLLRAQGYFKACAGITLPNPASVGLHEAFGFHLVGIYRGIGFKQGAWHDVAWYEAAVQPECKRPAPPTSIVELLDGPAWHASVARGVAQYGG